MKPAAVNVCNCLKMRILIVFLVVFFQQNLLVFAQLEPIPLGTWRSHFDYSKGKTMAYASGKIYFGAENGLFLYNIAQNEATILGLDNGFSDLNARAIDYHAPTKTLILAYENGGIDLARLDNEADIEEINSIQSIKNSNTLLGSKNTNEIFINGNKVIISTDFGLVQLDLLKGNIIEVDKNLGINGLEIPIYSVAVLGNKIFALSNSQIISANLNSNLQSFESWEHNQLPLPISSGKKQLIIANNTVYLLLGGLGLFEWVNGKFEKLIVFSETNFAANYNGDKIYIALNNRLLTYDFKTKIKIEQQENSIILPQKLLINQNVIWLADNKKGVISNYSGTFLPSNPTPSPGLVTVRNDSIITDQIGLKYTILPAGNGLQITDKTGKTKVFQSIPLLQNNSKNSNTVNSIAVDKNNIIYLALNGGIVALNSSPEILESTSLLNFISTPVIDGVRTLANELVLSIAVDAGNRKWVGTAAGLYLFDEDLSKIIEKFTVNNSPLPSNSIYFLNLEGNTGELFIYTNNGIVSYRTNSTESTDSQMNNVLVFPNPVLPQYSGTVGISGLVANADVKITDIAGRLLYKTKANGGTASWDLTTPNGNRAESGIYYIFSSNLLGKETLVTKLAVIK